MNVIAREKLVHNLVYIAQMNFTKILSFHYEKKIRKMNDFSN
jgi:hypothetical protein